jgi:hypothetical protein
VNMGYVNNGLTVEGGFDGADEEILEVKKRADGRGFGRRFAAESVRPQMIVEGW